LHSLCFRTDRSGCPIANERTQLFTTLGHKPRKHH
jgi:hypothetical protein